MSVQAWWITAPPPEPDENGEIPCPQATDDGWMRLGMLNVTTKVWRPVSVAELMQAADKLGADNG